MSSSDASPPSSLSPLPEYWDGEITPDIQRRLREARIRLGLPYKSVGALLGVDWSTVRKWEKGMSRRCSLTVRPRLERLLAGGYDGMYSERPAAKRALMREPAVAPAGLTGDAALRPVLEGAATMYRLCGSHPEVQAELLRQIEAATLAALARLGQG